MPSPLFSTYRGGENRVTSSLLAVFERIELSIVERILGAAAEESALSLVSFSNQAAAGTGTVPDARIGANFQYLFEVKIKDETIRPDQIRGHLAHLTGSHRDEKLFVLTTDAVQPAAMSEFDDDPRVRWSNFITISGAIDEVLEDQAEMVGERTSFLLRELRALFRVEGLLDFDDTVVVAARSAYAQYLNHSVYICQPGRSFQKAITHLGFYAGGEIKPEVPLILYTEDQVNFSSEEVATRRSGSVHDQSIGEVIDTMLRSGERVEGQTNKVFILSAPKAPETVVLSKPIVNDTLASSGRVWAWTLGQRYTSLHKLKKEPTTTSALDQ